MPVLNWIGKEKIVNHDKEVPFRLLKKNQKYSLGNSENLILEGDNLEALKALMPFYYGKVKCIYIDPPYNTGNEKWIYNDKVNAPKIKEWLGKVVGPEGEDLTRHDKWLCMMYPRLKLLKDLLGEDGVIFISIDDNEQHYMRSVLDEIFGIQNFIAKIVWEGALKNDSRFVSQSHDYIFVYAKNKDFLKLNNVIWRIRKKGLGIIYKKVNQLKNEHNTDYSTMSNQLKEWFSSLNKNNPAWKSRHYNWIDKNGVYFAGDISAESGRSRPTYDVLHPVTKKPCKMPLRGWPTKKTMDSYITKGRIHWGQDEAEVPKLKHYLEETEGQVIASVIYKDRRAAMQELKNIMGKIVFQNPKDPEVLSDLIDIVVDKEDIVLDSFAGSGTTAHAVLKLNKEDNGNRKFILVELEKKIAKKITAERVKRVAKGYSYKKSNGQAVKVPGLGGGFEYVELGDTLFDKDGMISKSVNFAAMARYVYFTETRTNLEKKNIQGDYLGSFSGNHYFLLFNGIGKNILSRKFLRNLKSLEGKKIIYADKCLLDDETLEKNQIIFKQIPYAIKIY
jgi:adenine-specific DNA-methyltransferase